MAPNVVYSKQLPSFLTVYIKQQGLCQAKMVVHATLHTVRKYKLYFHIKYFYLIHASKPFF